MSEKLIMFSWNNYFYRTIQQGIQAGHSWVDMAIKYRLTPLVEGIEEDQHNMFWEWAGEHKTVNVRNGGDMLSIEDIITQLASFDSEDKLKYPFDAFYEDETQGGQLTSVSIVIPEHVFAHNPAPRPDPEMIGSVSIMPAVHLIAKELDEVDQYLYDLIKSTRLAD